MRWLIGSFTNQWQPDAIKIPQEKNILLTCAVSRLSGVRICKSEDFFLSSIYQGKDLIKIIALKISNHYNCDRFPLLIWNDHNMTLCFFGTEFEIEILHCSLACQLNCRDFVKKMNDLKLEDEKWPSCHIVLYKYRKGLSEKNIQKF